LAASFVTFPVEGTVALTVSGPQGSHTLTESGYIVARRICRCYLPLVVRQAP
jgi:hypothetical protein